MGSRLNILIYNLALLFILTGVMESCSHSKNGVMGSRKRKSHSMASRHQNRDFQDKKAADKKSSERVAEEHARTEKQTETPASTQVVADEIATISPAEEKLSTTEAENAASVNSVPVEITSNAINVSSEVAVAPVAHTVQVNTVAFHPNHTVITSAVNTNSAEISNDNDLVAENTEALAPQAAPAKQSARQQIKNAVANIKKESVRAAADAGKDSGSGWMAYFAVTQAFLALVIGLKQTFSLLDTPSDAGSKALPISYATIGLLAIHAIVVIALVKNFII